MPEILARDIFVAILAGGSGTRLWPYSRRNNPKHLLPLFDGKSTIQLTVERILPFVPADNIYIVTAEDHAAQIAKQIPIIPQQNFVIEPLPRGTAACIGLAALHIRQRSSSGIMVSLPADHIIENESRFREILAMAATQAAQGHLVTLGIVPSFPETGFGYIHRGKAISTSSTLPVYQVSNFTEKPDNATAERFLSTGDYYWNSGMFIWKADRILEELGSFQPDIHAALESISPYIDSHQESNVLNDIWPSIRQETIDVAVMEKTRDVVVIPSDIGWNDIGNWSALSDVLDQDHDGNITLGDGQIITLDSNDSLYFSSGRLVAAIGIKDMIVVDTDDVTLICPKNRAQQVREIVQKLRNQTQDEIT